MLLSAVSRWGHMGCPRAGRSAGRALINRKGQLVHLQEIGLPVCTGWKELGLKAGWEAE